MYGISLVPIIHGLIGLYWIKSGNIKSLLLTILSGYYSWSLSHNSTIDYNMNLFISSSITIVIVSVHSDMCTRIKFRIITGTWILYMMILRINGYKLTALSLAPSITLFVILIYESFIG